LENRSKQQQGVTDIFRSGNQIALSKTPGASRKPRTELSARGPVDYAIPCVAGDCPADSPPSHAQPGADQAVAADQLKTRKVCASGPVGAIMRFGQGKMVETSSGGKIPSRRSRRRLRMNTGVGANRCGRTEARAAMGAYAGGPRRRWGVGDDLCRFC
jgi:hypothetical protein